jgi:hypothetical protein
VSWLRDWWSRRVDRTLVWLDAIAEEGVVPKARRRLRRRDPDRRLLRDETVMDEVGHHWIAYTWPVVVLVAAALLLVRSLLAVPVDVLWIPLLVCLLLAGYGVDKFLRVRLERFLITDSRVMRLSGVYSRKSAWMPLSRVLDITVDRPFWQRPLGCGHLVLENAAQEQGLRAIRFIARPSERALLIHALRTGRADVPGARSSKPPGPPAHSPGRHPPGGPPVPVVPREQYRGHRLA